MELEFPDFFNQERDGWGKWVRVRTFKDFQGLEALI